MIVEYECELLDEQDLRSLRVQVLTTRLEGIEASAISYEEVKAMATQISEANGVELWTKNVDANVHYIVARGLIFIRYNFGGRKLFNWLAHGRWVYDLTKEPWGF